MLKSVRVKSGVISVPRRLEYCARVARYIAVARRNDVETRDAVTQCNHCAPKHRRELTKGEKEGVRRTSPQRRFYRHARGSLVRWTAFRSIRMAPDIDDVTLFKARCNRYDYVVSVTRLNPSPRSLSVFINPNLIRRAPNRDSS